MEEATNPLYAAASKNAPEEHAKKDATSSVGSIFPFVRPAVKDRNERLKAWETAFEEWIKGGLYTSGLLPCFETELHRHFQVKDLSAFLLESCNGLKMPAFERWILDSKLEERLEISLKRMPTDRIQEAGSSYNDPILPRNPSLESESCKRLEDEICETGLSREKARSIVKDLFRRTQSACQAIHGQEIRCANQTPFKSDRIEAEHGSYLVSLLFAKKKWKAPFIVKISDTHYRKLKHRFLIMHQHVISGKDMKNDKKRNKKVLHSLHLLMMVITLRYSSLSGGQLLDDFRGGGMQGAINEQGFAVLEDLFPQSNLMECFGSPFNATLPCFASAFESVDWHFGSACDIAQCPSFKDNVCGEANPPFSPGFMEFLADWISDRLLEANNNNFALSFVVIVPSVHDRDVTEEGMRVASAVKRFAANAHRQMTKSEECTHHMVLPAGEHGYVEGAQHLRPTRYKRSLYDTSVILLQSQKAKENKLDLDNFESSIREAFAERHSEESRKRAKLS